MPLAIMKPSLVPVVSYNKFNQFQKTDSECKSQDICQELTVTSEVILKYFFLRYLEDSGKHSDKRMVYATSL